MPCILDNGYNLGCNTIGGIEDVWIGTYDPEVTYDDTTDPDGIITLLVDNPNAVDCYNFQQDIEFAGLEQTGTFSRENGTVFYESVLSLKFIHLDANLRNLIKALGKAPIFAVVKSNQGDYYILGVESAGRATEGASSLGTAMGDMNGSTLSFTFKSIDPAYLCDGAILNTGVADPTLITVNATT
jgi:hypothetical protein